jgi:hypothetical protein
VPALRRAAGAQGHFSDDELARWGRRDITRGRRIVAPAHGTVAGVSSAGELLVLGADGAEARYRSGTLTFAEPLACS